MKIIKIRITGDLNNDDLHYILNEIGQSLEKKYGEPVNFDIERISRKEFNKEMLNKVEFYKKG